MLQSIFKKYDENKLGRFINSWTFVPPKSKKFMGYAIGIIGGLLIAALAYGSSFIPGLDKIGSGVRMLALFLLPTLFAYLVKFQKNKIYSLYEDGFVMQHADKKSKDSGQIALWKDFKGCSYSDHGVKLFPKSWLSRSIFLHCTSNRMEVYTLCRERIDAFRFGFVQLQSPEKKKKFY